MDFVPQPEAAKKFPSMAWFKWHIYKYPNVFIIALPVPIIVYRLIEAKIRLSRGLADGTYVPNIMHNKYVVCRSDDWMAQNTPDRYKN